MNAKDRFIFMDRLADAETSLNSDDFLEMFGKRDGSHLWLKFSRGCQFSVIRLWGVLSRDNRVILVETLQDFMSKPPF